VRVIKTNTTPANTPVDIADKLANAAAYVNSITASADVDAIVDRLRRQAHSAELNSLFWLVGKVLVAQGFPTTNIKNTVEIAVLPVDPTKGTIAPFALENDGEWCKYLK
jgi:hypothetical protein